MKCYFAIILACVVGGCLTGPHRFNSQRAETYISRHPDLSGSLAERLLVGRVEKGMPKEAVRICLGSPNRRRTTMVGGESREVWEFSEPAYNSGELQHSEMWSEDVPTARIRFGSDDCVDAYWYFGAYGHTELPPKKIEPSRKALPPQKHSREVPVEKQKNETWPVSDSVEPQVNTIPTVWPELTLNGVSVMDETPYAMINRSVVAQGEKIDGVTVLYVKPDGVYLRLGESICFLAIGKQLKK